MNERILIQVKDVMKSHFDIVDGMITVEEALMRMEHASTKCLIIDKRNEQDEYGIVLISDIAKMVLARDKAPDRVNVYEIMSKPVLSVEADMDIRYCARLFARFGLTRSPVMHDGKIVGIVSLTDMVIRGMKNDRTSEY